MAIGFLLLDLVAYGSILRHLASINEGYELLTLLLGGVCLERLLNALVGHFAQGNAVLVGQKSMKSLEHGGIESALIAFLE